MFHIGCALSSSDFRSDVSTASQLETFLLFRLSRLLCVTSGLICLTLFRMPPLVSHLVLAYLHSSFVIGVLLISASMGRTTLMLIIDRLLKAFVRLSFDERCTMAHRLRNILANPSICQTSHVIMSAKLDDVAFFKPMKHWVFHARFRAFNRYYMNWVWTSSSCKVCVELSTSQAQRLLSTTSHHIMRSMNT